MDQRRSPAAGVPESEACPESGYGQRNGNLRGLDGFNGPRSEVVRSGFPDLRVCRGLRLKIVSGIETFLNSGRKDRGVWIGSVTVGGIEEPVPVTVS